MRPYTLVLALALASVLGGCGVAPAPEGGGKLTIHSPPDGAQVPAGARVLLAGRVEGTEAVVFSMQGVPRGTLSGPELRALVMAGPKPGESAALALQTPREAAGTRIVVGPPGVPRAFAVEALSPQLDGPDGALPSGPVGVLFSDAPAAGSVQAEAEARDGSQPGAGPRIELRATPTELPEMWLLWPEKPLGAGVVHRIVVHATRAVDGAALSSMTEFPVARPKSGPVCGWIVDQKMRPVAGASVEGPAAAAVTDAQGFFRIEDVREGPATLAVRRGAGKSPTAFRIAARGTNRPTYLPWPIVLDAPVTTGAALARAGAEDADDSRGNAGRVRLREPGGAPISGAAVCLDGRWLASVSEVEQSGTATPAEARSAKPRPAIAFVASLEGACEAIPVTLAPGVDGMLEGTLARAPGVTGPWHAFARSGSPALYWPAVPDARVAPMLAHATRRLVAAGWLSEGDTGPQAVARTLARLQALLFLDGNGDRTDGLVRLPARPLEPLGSLGPATLAALDRALPPPALRRLGDLPPLPRVGLERALPLPPTPAHLLALAGLEELEHVRAPLLAGPALAAARAPADRVRVGPLPDGFVRVRLATAAAAPRSPPAASSGWRVTQLATTAGTLRSMFVEESAPAPGDSLVACATAAWVRLRTPVDAAKLSLETVQLIALGPIADAGAARSPAAPGAIPIAVCLLDDARTLIVRPARPLAPWTGHMLVVRAAAIPAAGAADVVIAFATGPGGAAAAGTWERPAIGSEWLYAMRPGDGPAGGLYSARLADGVVRWWTGAQVPREAAAAAPDRAALPALPSAAPGIPGSPLDLPIALPSPIKAGASPAIPPGMDPTDAERLRDMLAGDGGSGSSSSGGPLALPSLPALPGAGAGESGGGDRVALDGAGGAGAGLPSGSGPAGPTEAGIPALAPLENGFHTPVTGLTPAVAAAVRGITVTTADGASVPVVAFSISAIGGLLLNVDLSAFVPGALLIVKLVLDEAQAAQLNLPSDFRNRFTVRVPSASAGDGPAAPGSYPVSLVGSILLGVLLWVLTPYRSIKLRPLRFERGGNWLARAMLLQLIFGLPHLWIGIQGFWLPAGAFAFGLMCGAGVQPFFAFRSRSRAGEIVTTLAEVLAPAFAYAVVLAAQHASSLVGPLSKHRALVGYPERWLSANHWLSAHSATVGHSRLVLAAMVLAAFAAWASRRFEITVPVCPYCGAQPDPRLLFGVPPTAADAAWRAVEAERWRNLTALRGELVRPEAAAAPSIHQLVMYDCSACSFARVELQPPKGTDRGADRIREMNGDPARAAIAQLRILAAEVLARPVTSRR